MAENKEIKGYFVRLPIDIIKEIELFRIRNDFKSRQEMVEKIFKKVLENDKNGNDCF